MKKELKSSGQEEKPKKNKHGYDLSNFIKFDLPVQRNPSTGRLEVVEVKTVAN